MYKKFDDGYLFEEKIFLTYGKKFLDDKINLTFNQGEHIMKNKPNEFVVNYPGEYEKFNIFIRCYGSSSGRLNFFINDFSAKKYFAIIQDAEILKNLDLSEYPLKWFYFSDNVKEMLEKLGFEGNFILVNSIDDK